MYNPDSLKFTSIEYSELQWIYNNILLITGIEIYTVEGQFFLMFRVLYGYSPRAVKVHSVDINMSNNYKTMLDSLIFD